MSIAIITIQSSDDEQMKVRVEFEPAIDQDGDVPPTHIAAIHAVQSIQEMFGETEG